MDNFFYLVLCTDGFKDYLISLTRLGPGCMQGTPCEIPDSMGYMHRVLRRVPRAAAELRRAPVQASHESEAGVMERYPLTCNQADALIDVALWAQNPLSFEQAHASVSTARTMGRDVCVVFSPPRGSHRRESCYLTVGGLRKGFFYPARARRWLTAEGIQKEVPADGT